METTLMNTENSKANEIHKSVLNLSQRSDSTLIRLGFMRVVFSGGGFGEDSGGLGGLGRGQFWLSLEDTFLKKPQVGGMKLAFPQPL